MQMLSSIEGPEVRFASNLKHRVLTLGFIWAVASGILALLSYGFFFLTTPGVSVYAPGFALLSPAAALLVAGILFRLEHQRGHHGDFIGTIGAFCISLCWLMIGWYVFEIWQIHHAAEKFLTVGFFSVTLAFFARSRLLVVSLPPLAIGYVYIVFNNPELSFLDQVLSILMFPALVAVLIFTLRSLLRLAQDKNQQNMSYAEKIKVINHTDELTGIANRKGFDEVLNNAMNLSNRFHTPLSIVVVNIDFFRKYNEAMGYPAGNKCLQKLAQLLPDQAKRAVDLVARTGDEEFTMVLPGCDLHQAEMLIDKEQKALVKEAIVNPGLKSKGLLTLSYGVAVHGGDTPESLYRKAGQALLLAKKNGRNRYEVFSPIV